ncbi:Uma2 family endonuclease [Leptolyngbya cf. ectocarpi LEGE 11479]|uniref:Uma2 family endonuclease n=1 Tax=Leptolyngbya cf. ectocarpi LEGE 11479 TaxID=1828722 RepID=A0A928ZTI8_LEPEC|nr:Uma2 family endonuclease [Leptolyngbya ectocarpi]MBE9065699.1 Uma2 family endonuclease [Leptolyngbya cf. ectocarpi LEGE 11479]
MVQTRVQSLTLDAFLKLPETQPASEFINNQLVQKPMPQGEHSLLQVALCKAIDGVAESQRIAKAFSELRCVFGGAVVVPDVSVFRWQRIPRKASGRIANRFETYPDWAIEILSPAQAQTKPLEKLLHCIEHGTELGWLLDPEADSVLTISSESRIKLHRNQEIVPVLSDLELALSAQDIFDWLVLPQ